MSREAMPSTSDAPLATLRVTSGGKIRAYVKYSLEILPVCMHRISPAFANGHTHRASYSTRQQCRSVARSLNIFPNGLARSQHSTSLTITAEGNAVCKAVSVAEITKRRLRGLHQNTQIGLTEKAAASAVPTIAITLSLAQLDTSQPGYQPPLTDEELHAAWIFDEEATRLDALGLDEEPALGKASAPPPGSAADEEELQLVEEPPAAAATAAAVAADGASAQGRQRSRTRKRKRGGGRGAGASAPSIVVAPRPRAEDSNLVVYD